MKKTFKVLRPGREGKNDIVNILQNAKDNKGPATPYDFFMKEEKAKIVAANPDITINDINQILAERWKVVEADYNQLQKYQKLADEAASKIKQPVIPKIKLAVGKYITADKYTAIVKKEDIQVRDFVYKLIDINTKEAFTDAYKTELDILVANTKDKGSADKLKNTLEKVLSSLNYDSIKTLFKRYIEQEVVYETYFADYIKQYNKNPEQAKEEDKIRTFFIDIQKRIKNSQIGYSETLNELIEFKLKVTNEKVKSILERMGDLDFQDIRKLIREYLEQYLNQYDKFGAPIPVKVISFDTFGADFIAKQTAQKQARKAREQAIIEAAKETVVNKSIVPAQVTIRKQDINKVLSGTLDVEALELADEDISNLFTKLSKQYVLGDTVNVYYLRDVIKAIQNDSTTNRDFATKVGEFLVYFEPAMKIRSSVFVNRVKQKYYSPDTLSRLSPQEKLPEIYLNPGVDDATKNAVSDKLVFLLQKYIDNFGSRLYSKKFKRGKAALIDTEVDFPLLEITADMRTGCVNKDLIKQIPEHDLIWYTENGKVYCLSITELQGLFEQNKYINPYTNSPLDIDFIQTFKRTYLNTNKVYYAPEKMFLDVPVLRANFAVNSFINPMSGKPLEKEFIEKFKTTYALPIPEKEKPVYSAPGLIEYIYSDIARLKELSGITDNKALIDKLASFEKKVPATPFFNALYNTLKNQGDLVGFFGYINESMVDLGIEKQKSAEKEPSEYEFETNFKKLIMFFVNTVINDLAERIKNSVVGEIATITLENSEQLTPLITSYYQNPNKIDREVITEFIKQCKAKMFYNRSIGPTELNIINVIYSVYFNNEIQVVVNPVYLSFSPEEKEIEISNIINTTEPNKLILISNVNRTLFSTYNEYQQAYIDIFSVQNKDMGDEPFDNILSDIPEIVDTEISPQEPITTLEDTETDVSTDTNTTLDAGEDTDTDTNTTVDANVGEDTDTESDTTVDANVGEDTDTESDTTVDANVGKDTDTESDTTVDANVGEDTDTESDTTLDTDTTMDTETDEEDTVIPDIDQQLESENTNIGNFLDVDPTTIPIGDSEFDKDTDTSTDDSDTSSDIDNNEPVDVNVGDDGSDTVSDVGSVSSVSSFGSDSDISMPDSVSEYVNLTPTRKKSKKGLMTEEKLDKNCINCGSKVGKNSFKTFKVAGKNSADQIEFCSVECFESYNMPKAKYK